MLWFVRALEERWARKMPYSVGPERLAIVYSDAESHGAIAAVFVCEGTVQYMRGVIPRKLMSLFQCRKTNIVAYELIAAIWL